MSGMVANPKDLLYQGCHPAASPHLSDEAVVLGSLGQEFGESGQLVGAKVWCRPGGRTMAQCLDAASFSGSPEPLTHGSTSDTESLGDIDSASSSAP